MTNIFRISYSYLRPLYERTAFHRSVIEDLGDKQLKEAYAHCREITRDHAKTFYMATRFLPNEKQRGIFAIYALCRYMDDLVDEAEDLIQKKKITIPEIEERLDRFKYRLSRVYEGEQINDPILLAFSDTLRQFNISIELPFLLMEGVKTDLTKSRFNYFSEVHDYSYKVASVVGLMTSEVFGYKEKEALSYAIDLGIAMQLTNILRDIGEDLRKGRIYIPANELEMFGVSEDDLFQNRLTDNFVNLMKFQVKRARNYYDKADIGIKMLSKDSQLPVYLARHNYSRILDKIEENNFEVFDQRAYLNYTEKLFILPRAFWDVKAAG